MAAFALYSGSSWLLQRCVVASAPVDVFKSSLRKQGYSPVSPTRLPKCVGVKSKQEQRTLQRFRNGAKSRATLRVVCIADLFEDE